METRDARSTHRRTSSGNTPPARPVRGRPWKRTVTSTVRRPGRGSLFLRGRRNPLIHGAIGRHTTPQRKTARIAENSRLTGRLRWWWQVLVRTNVGRADGDREIPPVLRRCVEPARRWETTLDERRPAGPGMPRRSRVAAPVRSRARHRIACERTQTSDRQKQP